MKLATRCLIFTCIQFIKPVSHTNLILNKNEKNFKMENAMVISFAIEFLFIVSRKTKNNVSLIVTISFF